MVEKTSTESAWLAVIGRALAYMCMKAEVGEGKKLQEKAKFLEGLGLSRADAASILGTTAASISELHRQARKKKGAKHASAKKKR
jgi:hypothetical protein